MLRAEEITCCSESAERFRETESRGFKRKQRESAGPLDSNVLSGNPLLHRYVDRVQRASVYFSVLELLRNAIL